MSARSTPLIHIAAAPSAVPLSAQQKKFNASIQRVEAERALLAAWEQAASAYQARYVREFVPLLNAYRGLSSELAHFLDEASGRKGLTRADRDTLSAAIADIAGDLASGAPTEAVREAMKALYNRHAGTDFDAEQAQVEQVADDLVREAAEELFDLDLDSPEDVARRVEEQMQARQAEAERARAAHQAKRRKPGARERQSQEDARQATQSLREIYRKLAAALHPDRETDPTERERKTALMKRVNQAYEANNLLDLLHLQLEAEQIDPGRIAALGDERLKPYNRVLAEQLAELRQQVRATQYGFCADFGLDPLRSKPATVMKHFTQQMQGVQGASDELRAQLRVLRADPAMLKPWIKDERAAQRQREMEEGVFDEELLRMLGGLGAFGR